MVFSTVTQPDYTGLREISWPTVELLPEHGEFYRVLRRTSAHWEIGTPTPLKDIAERMAQQQNMCAIVNLRAHAPTLYQALAPLEAIIQVQPERQIRLRGALHLCPGGRPAVPRFPL